MVTTGELRAIIEELQLVDIGDAASYLGEEAMVGEELGPYSDSPDYRRTASYASRQAVGEALGPYSDSQRTASYASRQAVGEASLVGAVTGQATAFTVPITVEEINGVGALSMSAQ